MSSTIKLRNRAKSRTRDQAIEKFLEYRADPLFCISITNSPIPEEDQNGWYIELKLGRERCEILGKVVRFKSPSEFQSVSLR